MKIIATLGFVVALVLAGATSASASESATFEKAIKTAGNVQRTAVDAKALAHSPCLDTYAEKWAKHIAAKKTLTHRTSKMFVSIMKKCKKTSIGENLAMGQASGGAVVSAWMNSPGHRANLLNKGFRYVGIGSVKVDGRWWTAQLLAG